MKFVWDKSIKRFLLYLCTLTKNMSSKNLIPVLGAIIVVGALIQRDFQRAGLIVALLAIAVLLIVRFRMVVHHVRRFRFLSRIGKVRVMTYLGLLYIFIHALVAGQIAYFLLLLILGIEYLIDDRQKWS